MGGMKSMKIALLAPAGAMHRYTGNFGKAIHYAPLTLTSLAGYVPEELGAQVQIFDETVEKIPLEIDADIIGITAITGTAPRAYAYSEHFRKKGIATIIGGPHPTLMPMEAKQHADSVAVGFAERTFPQMLLDFKTGSLKDFYYADKENDFLLVKPPLRQLLKKDGYITVNSMEATRGCVNDCAFCAVYALHKGKLFKRPVKDVIAEMEQLGGKDVLFIDPNLIADPEYSRELFREMIPLKKWWFGLSTADIVHDKELIALMAKSGCKGLLIGFESINQLSLSDMNKTRNKNVDYFELMRVMHAHGIAVNGTFCFGSDEDGPDVFERTVEYVIKLKLDLPRYSILTPFPGTSLYEKLKTEGRITDDNWAMYDVEHCVFKPKKMSAQQLEEGNIYAWTQTYSTPSILKRIARLHKVLPLNFMCNYAYKNYADRLREFDRKRMVDNTDIKD